MSDRLTDWQANFDRRVAGEVEVDEAELERLAAGVREGWAILTEDRLMAVATLLGERKRMSIEIERLTSLVSTLESDLGGCQAANHMAVDDVNRLTEKVECLRSELADRDAAIKRLGAMAISKVGRSASLTEHCVMVAEAECEDLRSRLASSEAAIDGAMEQVGDIQPELCRLEREVERLTADLAETQESFGRLAQSVRRVVKEDESDPVALASLLDAAVAGLRARAVAEADAWASDQRSKDLEEERDAALARAERAEGRESILVDKIAHAEAALWAAENGEVSPAATLEDVAETFGDVDLRAGEGDASMPGTLDGWTHSPTEDRYEGPNERSAYVFDGEFTIEGPGLPGHSAVDLSVPVAVARALLIRSETRPAR